MRIMSILLVTLFLTSPQSSANGAGWMASYSTEIGVSFSNPPETGAEFAEVTGNVNDPDMIMALGFENINRGDNVTVYDFHRADFTVTENGTEFTPAIIRMEIGSQYHILTPQEGTPELKSLATGDRNAKPGGGTCWIPSYSTEIGINFINPPESGQPFTTVTGRVSDVEPLEIWGFSGLEQGQNISLSQEVPLYLNGSAKALIRISTDDYYEVLVVEDNERLVAVTRYW